MGTRPESVGVQTSRDRWLRGVHHFARPLAWAVRVLIGVPLLWLTFAMCPGSAKGRIVGEWDTLTRSGMRDVVAPMKYWHLHRLPDGTAVAIEWGSWIRYNGSSEAVLHDVQLEGAATFEVGAATPLQVTTSWGTIRSGARPAIVRVEYVPYGPCSLTVYTGEILTVSRSGRSTTIPEGSWLDCSGHHDIRLLSGAAPARIP